MLARGNHGGQACDRGGQTSPGPASLIDALGLYLRQGSRPLTLRQSMASTRAVTMPDVAPETATLRREPRDGGPLVRFAESRSPRGSEDDSAEESWPDRNVHVRHPHIRFVRAELLGGPLTVAVPDL